MGIDSVADQLDAPRPARGEGEAEDPRLLRREAVGGGDAKAQPAQRATPRSSVSVISSLLRLVSVKESRTDVQPAGAVSTRRSPGATTAPSCTRVTEGVQSAPSSGHPSPRGCVRPVGAVRGVVAVVVPVIGDSPPSVAAPLSSGGVRRRARPEQRRGHPGSACAGHGASDRPTVPGSRSPHSEWAAASRLHPGLVVGFVPGLVGFAGAGGGRHAVGRVEAQQPRGEGGALRGREPGGPSSTMRSIFADKVSLRGHAQGEEGLGVSRVHRARRWDERVRFGAGSVIRLTGEGLVVAHGPVAVPRAVALATMSDALAEVGAAVPDCRFDGSSWYAPRSK